MQIPISREKPFILQKNPNLYVVFYSFSKNPISVTFLNFSPWICAPKASFFKNTIYHFLNFFSSESVLLKILSCKEQIWCHKDNKYN